MCAYTGHDQKGFTGIGWYPVFVTTDQKVGGSSRSGRPAYSRSSSDTMHPLDGSDRYTDGLYANKARDAAQEYSL